MKGNKMNTFESPELTFPAKVLEMTANADSLIDKYTETLAVLESIPEEDRYQLPNFQEAFELAEQTVNTLMELKVTVKSLFEHSSEMNDKVEEVLRRITSKE
jgi:predicted ATP-grasp superfamily ATP-dependent carboligase